MMKQKFSIYILVLSLTLISNIPGFAQWNLIQTSFTLPIRDIYFLSENIGYGVTNDGNVLRTTNGGMNWVSEDINPSVLNRIQFVNSSTGYIAGYGVNVYKTTNGGINWVAKNLGAPYQMINLEFANANTGWISGQGEKILRTTNGGNNWTQLTIEPGLTYAYSMKFTSANTGYISAPNGKIFRTSNAGVNWNLIYSNPNRVLGGVMAFDNFNVYVCADSGKVIASVDGGAIWIERNTGINTFWNDGYMTDIRSAWVVSNTGKIAYTTNFGIDWTQQSSGITSNLYHVKFITGSTNTAFIAGDSGRILKTTNAGGLITSIGGEINQVPSKFSLSQNYPNPFNPSTRIEFSLPESGNVKLEVFDIRGRIVNVLANGKYNSGIHSVNFDASQLNAGVYYYRINYNGLTEVRKMVLLK